MYFKILSETNKVPIDFIWLLSELWKMSFTSILIVKMVRNRLSQTVPTIFLVKMYLKYSFFLNVRG